MQLMAIVVTCVLSELKLLLIYSWPSEASPTPCVIMNMLYYSRLHHNMCSYIIMNITVYVFTVLL